METEELFQLLRFAIGCYYSEGFIAPAENVAALDFVDDLERLSESVGGQF